MEHGFFGHPAGRMFPTLLHVPLIVRDGQRKYTYKHPFSMVNFPGLVKAQAELGKRSRAVAGEECYSAGYRDLHPRIASIRKGDALVVTSAVSKPLYFQLGEDPQAQYPIGGSPDLPFVPTLNEVNGDVLRYALSDNASPTLTADEEAALNSRLEALGYA